MCENKKPNSQTQYKNIFGVNLSTNEDPDFKMAQILQADTALLFDLRQTLKGRKTKTGICLQLPEFKWFVNCLLVNNNKINIMEHDSRVIKLEKSADQIIISVRKADNTTRCVTLNQTETHKLINHLEEFKRKMIDKALDCGHDTDFNEFDYVKIINE